VDGEAITFGNQGALFMNAMTWYDHKTESLWSQPWGSAIHGNLEGTALTLISASIVPWSTWTQEHPDTTVVIDGLDVDYFAVERGYDKFVIGVALEDSATAFPYVIASEQGVINDAVGEHPVAVFVTLEPRDIKVYLRRVANGDGDVHELSFELDGEERVLDTETGSVWDTARGVAVEGPLKGAVLQQIPYVSSYDWAWSDFFPHTTFYES
jgi:hypothetical protein